MSLDIQFKFYSTIEDLEDEFLGHQITPTVFVERIFYETVYSDDIEVTEPVLEERSRTKERSGYDYTEDLADEFDYTSLNYMEFDSASWNHLVYGYFQWFSEKEISNCLKRIDDFVENINVDFQTKQFTLTKLLNQAKYSIEQLQQIRKQNYINEFQKDLLDVFVQIYNLLVRNIQSQKYQPFLLKKEKEPISEIIESQETSNNILNTKYYKMLSDVGFVEVIKETYPNPQKIIATLGRSNGFKGYVFDVQKEYYAFCTIIKFIEHIEKHLFYDSRKIGQFLADLSSFSSEHANYNFKRYYEARLNPNNTRHYASNDKNVDKVQFVLKNLSQK